MTSFIEEKELEPLFFSRQPSQVTEKLRTACIGIAGCGGLGTVVAENLTRAGAGKLIIADYDVVEPSNLNRQRFFVSQIGMPKVEALADNLRRSNPFIDIVPAHEKITADNCSRIFAGCSIVAECFDNPAHKAELIFGIRKHLSDCIIVAASGLAGIAGGDSIRTTKISDHFFLVGDMVSDADSGAGLFASRVGIAASMQAHCIIRLLAGEPL